MLFARAARDCSVCSSSTKSKRDVAVVSGVVVVGGGLAGSVVASVAVEGCGCVDNGCGWFVDCSICGCVSVDCSICGCVSVDCSICGCVSVMLESGIVEFSMLLVAVVWSSVFGNDGVGVLVSCVASGRGGVSGAI